MAKDEVKEAAKYSQRPGDPKVQNIYTDDDKVNADGSVTPVYNNKDKQFMGETTPPIHWSLRNSFTIFKDWFFHLICILIWDTRAWILII